jgi:DNA-binding response OmpR family regulator
MARVLVVDDEAPMSVLLAHYLGSAGHSVTLAGNALESAIWLGLRPFDLIVLNVMDGSKERLNWCRQLRNCSPNPDLRIVVVGDSPQMRASTYAAGADIFLPKPLRLEQFKECISLVSAPASPAIDLAVAC